MKHKMSTREIAVTALLMALSVICMVLCSLLPGISLTLYFVCTAFVAVLSLQRRVLLSVLLFIGTSLLGFILMANKLQIIPYILFFGHYGIWKASIESKIYSIPLQMLCKLVFYNIALVAGYFFAKDVLLGDMIAQWPLYVMAIAAQVIFVLFDIAASAFLRYYSHKLQPHLFKF